MTIAIIRKFPWSYGQSKVDHDHDQNSTIFVVKIVTPKLAIRLQGEHSMPYLSCRGSMRLEIEVEAHNLQRNIVTLVRVVTVLINPI